MTDYESKKRTFDNMITLYGRMPVLELLEDPGSDIFRLHLAEHDPDNKSMQRIKHLAEQRNVEIVRHTRQELSRISKNGRQDQGVAIDIKSKSYRSLNELSLKNEASPTEVIVLDGITNPQNLGLIIRVVAAAPITGLVLPKKGCASIDPLVHKASAGTLIKANIFHCPTIADAVNNLKQKGFEIVGLDGAGATQLQHLEPRLAGGRAYILGNETNGISENIKRLCDQLVSIPLKGKVESLNVATAATLVAFKSIFA
jgi:23S rRNA (guanosine2251-2'-O)-methyltransferase